MKSFWLRLGSKYQRWVVIGAVIIVGGVLVSFFSSAPPVMNGSGHSKQKNSRYIFTDRTTQETGIDHLSATVKLLSRQNEQLQGTLIQLQGSLDKKGKEMAAQEAKVDAKVQLIEQRMETIFEKDNPPQTARQQFSPPAPDSQKVMSDYSAADQQGWGRPGKRSFLYVKPISCTVWC